MQLNLVSFNCRVSKSWDGDDTWFAFDSCEEKNSTILNKDMLVNGDRFKSIFSGIGRFPVDRVNIQLTNDAVPVQKPAHRVSVYLKEKFENEIRSKEKQGIISRLDCNTATEWLNSFVVVKKPTGDLRICLDPTDLNKYIARPVCNSNTLDEVSFKLKDAKFFLVFDATKGYFHMPLNERSKLLTAMLTLIEVYVTNNLLYSRNIVLEISQAFTHCCELLQD